MDGGWWIGKTELVNESVLNGVRKYLRALREQGVAVKFGVVFGSEFTGFFNDMSSPLPFTEVSRQ